MGGGGEKEAGCNLHPWEGTVKEDRVPHPGKPLTKDISKERKETSEAQKRVQLLVCGRQDRERDLPRGSVPLPFRSQPETRVCWYRQGLGAGTGI